MFQRTVDSTETITFDEAVHILHVRAVDGTVNVVPTEGPARLEVAALEGEPLEVTLLDGVLTVSYKDLSWAEFGEAAKSVQTVKSYFSGLRRKRRVEVTVAVPAAAAVKVGTVSAHATVSGIAGEVGVHGASGDTTLAGLTGLVSANTVSGDVDAEGLSGELKVNTVSGAVTLVAGSATRIRAHSVSGAVTLDLDAATPTDIGVTTVSGAVGVRLPSFADAKVQAGTTSGTLSSAFAELQVGGGWGSKKLSGQLGSGAGRLQVTTVTGAVTVQRRPDAEEDRPAKELPAGPLDLTKEV
ncbi:DUF4097 domain-containing protein [Kitasatospora sp. NPDC059795]|uniref:DUF4097 family beta strand repeat-containing protein n=1 Tax=unclassified Kitasatospora TaxID=2633591 RepID=UPI00093E480F|nr:DUF4097 family beta strand repeat-containing protein [Kitasatospora sp. CB01950]OKJ07524.1 hypothetical protein AMK19_21610 [Kitasatospora sp. CB01950]